MKAEIVLLWPWQPRAAGDGEPERRRQGEREEIIE